MKNFVLALAVVAMLATPSYGSLLMNEPFTYADGNLVPNGGWTNHSAPPASSKFQAALPNSLRAAARGKMLIGSSVPRPARCTRPLTSPSMLPTRPSISPT